MELVEEMRIVAAMRIKNESRWLREVLSSIHPLTRDIMVFDDASTDETPDIAREMGCSVFASPFPTAPTDEARDKTWLLERVRALNPDYVLFSDGDEVLEAGAAEKIRQRLNPRDCLYCFPIKYIWNDRQHYRADGVYGRMQQWRMFSLIGQGGKLFYPSKGGANFHCGNAPKGLRGGGAMVPCDILHLGYMYREDRLRKYEWYRRIDPGNRSEDEYNHVLIGDTFPADSKFVHGGPLKLFTLPLSKWPIAQGSDPGLSLSNDSGATPRNHS